MEQSPGMHPSSQDEIHLFTLKLMFTAHSRSKINADCGSQSQMASLITSSLVILAIVFLLPALHYLPMCVLAAMYVVSVSASSCFIPLMLLVCVTVSA